MTEDCYLLRSNVNDWSGKELWETYIHLTDAEEAFRTLKNTLNIRPVSHHREDRVHAHVLVCFLAYVLQKTLEVSCECVGLGRSARKVLETINEIKIADVVLPTRKGPEIRLRCVTEPENHQAVLLEKLQLNPPRRLQNFSPM